MAILFRSTRKGILSLAALFAGAATHDLRAGSATWDLNPTSSDWTTAANWTPATVPNDKSDLATFGVSNTANVSLSSNISLKGIVFNPGASAFTTATNPENQFGASITFYGNGITNNSGIPQSFVVNMVSEGLTSYLNFLGHCILGSQLNFTLSANPSKSASWGGTVLFGGSASAGMANFHAYGNAHGQSYGGLVYFGHRSSAGNATLVVDGGSGNGSSGGSVSFTGQAGLDNAFITANGATTAEAAIGGIVSFAQYCSLGSGTVIANGGVNGGPGAAIWFNDFQGLGKSTTRFEILGNATMQVDQSRHRNVDIGSLEGRGELVMGVNSLTLGRNNLSTTFSGTISGDTGTALTKIGTGTLRLTGGGTFMGATVVTAGTLEIDNTTGSPTGSGPVQVTAGTLAGTGLVAGSVTLGTGTGTGAYLAPSADSSQPLIFTTQSSLTFNADSSYLCRLDSGNVALDEVVANGVTIEAGAQFTLNAGTQTLPPGTVLTVISNTAATPTSGTFANLPDGGTIVAGANTYQANYEGGDGNDLTLTVIE